MAVSAMAMDGHGQPSHHAVTVAMSLRAHPDRKDHEQNNEHCEERSCAHGGTIRGWR